MAVLEVLWSAGHGAYLVGGAVRDAILGWPVPESGADIATDARPERILELFPGSSYENRFGTVLARGHEITTFRRDHRYADHRHPERVTFSDDIFEDLARRDLTINAIAWGRRGPAGEMRELDPADGRGDLAARLVRAVGDPSRRFDEDALRLLRAVRIAARLDFSIEPITHAAMAAHAGDIEWVSEERVGSEIRRMLGEPVPSRAFRLMDQTGILATVLPELAALKQEPSRHATLAEPRLEHALATADRAMAQTGGDERSAVAGLLHPLGPAGARSVLERLRFASREVAAICRLIELLPFDYEPGWSEAQVRRFMRAVGVASLDALLSLRGAHDDASRDPDAAALCGALRARVATQRQAAVPLTLAELAIDGADLRTTLGMPEGPAIGFILDALLEEVVEEPASNRRATLLARAAQIDTPESKPAPRGPRGEDGLGSAT